MKAPSPDFLAILNTLVEHEVDFIIVGGVSAVLQGAPISTFDLDLVHLLTPENVDRLLSALQKLDAHYRGRGDQRLRPGPAHLKSKGHQLLMTCFGPLDLLGTIGTDQSYEDLLEHTVELKVNNLHLHVLDLETLIAIKEALGFEKDIASVPILKRTLKEMTAHLKRRALDDRLD